MRLALLAPVLALAACSAQPSSQGGAGAFSCPPAGTIVRFERGSPQEWLGADPNDPRVCLRKQGRQTVRLTTVLPTFEAGSLFDAALSNLPRLWPLEVGREISYSGFLRSAESWNPAEEGLYRNRVVVESEGTLRLQEKERAVWIVRRNAGPANGAGGQVNRFWIDKTTNTVLQALTEPHPPRAAISIAVPPAGPGLPEPISNPAPAQPTAPPSADRGT